MRSCVRAWRRHRTRLLEAEAGEMAQVRPCFRRKCFGLTPSRKRGELHECSSARDAQFCQLPESEALFPVVVLLRASFIDQPDWLR
jgi:hypothetical protein